MVKDPGKKTSPGSIRALNLPERREVRKDRHGRPTWMASGSSRVRLDRIDDVWDMVDEWWRPEPMDRRYYKVAMNDGTSFTLFHDRVRDIWYEQQT